MKKSEIKEGMIVEDSWYPILGTGIVKSVLKTRVKILFPNSKDTDRDGLTTYDNAHVRYLNEVK